jgi:hypothetical protein
MKGFISEKGMQTGLMGAMRPQSPHRSPRQAFGGNFKPAPKKTQLPKRKNLNDYMPVFRGSFGIQARPACQVPSIPVFLICLLGRCFASVAS